MLKGSAAFQALDKETTMRLLWVPLFFWGDDLLDLCEYTDEKLHGPSDRIDPGKSRCVWQIKLDELDFEA